MIAAGPKLLMVTACLLPLGACGGAVEPPAAEPSPDRVSAPSVAPVRTSSAAPVSTSSVAPVSEPSPAPVSESVDEVSDLARRAGQHFLDTYVEPGGRVRRIDENDDTVSEGQAYALLISLGLDDELRFQTVWSWTQQNLQQRDGLLAWHWAQGQVVDAQPAIDADVLTAYALALASQRFDRPDLLEDAKQVARAVLETATIPAREGRILVPPWATQRRLVNPSYLVPTAMAGLAHFTGDDEWLQVEHSARLLVNALTEPMPHLPPDWTALGADGSTLLPIASPTDDSPARTGLDAWRVLLNFAVDCSADGREIAARAWLFLHEHRDLSAIYDLTGVAAVDWSHPAALVGAASAAAAAGDAVAASALLQQASEMNRSSPSYYGSALLAVGYIILDSDRLGGCPPGLEPDPFESTEEHG